MVWFLNTTSAECNVCQANKVACVNSSSFYLCFGENVPNTDTLYHCKNGFDCTDLNAICIQSSSTRTPSCGDTSMCGMCSAHINYLFACTGRNTFRMCYGAVRPTGQIGYCPRGYVCYGGSDAVCVPEDSVGSVTCDVVNNDSTTSTTETSSTETTTVIPEILTPTQVCEQTRETGLHPTVPTDPYCKRYIYCFYANGVLQGLEYNCSSRTYYNIQKEQCVFNKPNYCL